MGPGVAGVERKLKKRGAQNRAAQWRVTKIGQGLLGEGRRRTGDISESKWENSEGTGQEGPSGRGEESHTGLCLSRAQVF